MKIVYALNYNSVIFHLHYILFKINIISVHYENL